MCMLATFFVKNKIPWVQIVNINKHLYRCTSGQPVFNLYKVDTEDFDVLPMKRKYLLFFFPLRTKSNDGLL